MGRGRLLSMLLNRYPVMSRTFNRHSEISNKEPPRIRGCWCHQCTGVQLTDVRCPRFASGTTGVPLLDLSPSNYLLDTSRDIEASSISNTVPKPSRVCSFLASEPQRCLPDGGLLREDNKLHLHHTRPSEELTKQAEETQRE